MALLWNIPDYVPAANQEVEVTTMVDPMYSRMENMLFTENNIPPAEIDMELVNFIEASTRGQRLSEMWRNLHIGRLTSSIFGDVLGIKSQPNSLVKRIMEGSCLERYPRLPEAVQWGIDKEERARADYITIKSFVNKKFSVEHTGLTLYSTHSFLGASSDGKVTEEDSVGLLEIKCPFSLNGINVSKMEVDDIMNMNNKNFCLFNTDAGPTLNRYHKYYAQVQGEMAIMGLPWCDFVVWTGASQNNICIDRIYFDANFVAHIIPKLVEFYMDFIYPLLYHK